MYMDNSFNTETGSRVRDLRVSHGWTREKLSEAADISVQFLSDLETGKKGMSALTLKKLSSALCVTSDYILFGRTEQNSDSVITEMLKTLPPSRMGDLEEIIRLIVNMLSTT